MASVLETVRPTVDATISRLAATRFVVDPIAGEELSRITSIVSSAYKRHGAIIEVALFHAIALRPIAQKAQSMSWTLYIMITTKEELSLLK